MNLRIAPMLVEDVETGFVLNEGLVLRIKIDGEDVRLYTPSLVIVLPRGTVVDVLGSADKRHTSAVRFLHDFNAGTSGPRHPSDDALLGIHAVSEANGGTVAQRKARDLVVAEISKRTQAGQWAPTPT